MSRQAESLRPTATQSHFVLTLASMPGVKLHIKGFESESHQLCDDYRLTIRLLTDFPLDSGELLGQDATLYLFGAQDPCPLSGTIEQWVEQGADRQGYHYRLVLASPLALLKRSRANRVFTRMSVMAIVKYILTAAGFPDNKLRSSPDGEPLPMTVQYDESDFEFISRLLKKHGYVFGFVEVSEGVCLHLCPGIRELAATMAPRTLDYQPPTGLLPGAERIWAIRRHTRLLTDSLHYDDYDYQGEGTLALGSGNETDVPGCGVDHRYAEHYRSLSQGRRLAGIRQRALDALRQQLIVDTDCRGLYPGQILHINGHPEFDGSYWVVRVEHRGEQGGSLDYGGETRGMTYRNQACLVPSALPYQAMPPGSRRVYATFHAVITQEVDEAGRYRIRLPFEQPPDGPSSSPTRLIQPYGGQDHGAHFPLTCGTEVLVCGENGDLDRPVILGALYNRQASSPVTADNAYQNCLATRAGHQLLMDDQPKREAVALSTGQGDNLLCLDAAVKGHSASLVSGQGELAVTARFDLDFSADGGQRLQCGAELGIEAGQSVDMRTLTGDIQMTAAADIRYRAGGDVVCQALQGQLSLSAKEQLAMAAGGEARFEVSRGDLSWLAPQGDIQLASGADITLGTGEGCITISQGGATVRLDSEGNLQVNARQITLSAENIVLRGEAILDN